MDSLRSVPATSQKRRFFDGVCQGVCGAAAFRQQPGEVTVPYGCKLEDLLAVLHDSAPEEAEAVVLQRRRVDHGLLAVGLKVHCLGEGRQFLALVERLGGASKVLDMNMYRHAQGSLCLVLPPVGNARAAIVLLECIERFTGSALFGD